MSPMQQLVSASEDDPQPSVLSSPSGPTHDGARLPVRRLTSIAPTLEESVPSYGLSQEKIEAYLQHLFGDLGHKIKITVRFNKPTT